jgi:hypothetical protein
MAEKTSQRANLGSERAEVSRNLDVAAFPASRKTKG